MPRQDLRMLFRLNDPGLKAEDVFADREDEWSAVARSLVARVTANHAAGFDVEDMESPRRNVLAFYGVGGIGKSALSRRIVEHLISSDDRNDRVDWPALDSSLGRILPVRLDLASHGGLDFESLVLALRVAVAVLGRPMLAFDLAFGRYWQHNHPNETLEEYLGRHTFFSRLSSSLAVPEQVRTALSDVTSALLLPGGVGALVGQTVVAVAQAIREHRRESRALAGCRRLADLLEAAPDQEALSYYAHLLAWDLSQLPAKHAATLVVVLDTFEQVGDRTHRDLERLIQRVVWLMPNTLFVITGRNRLQWDDPRLEGQLDWVGSRCWPLLAPGVSEEPRQHRVGYLSTQDSGRYLRRRLTLGGNPLMDQQTRQLIVTRSHGLPLYLDLAVMRFLDLYAHAGQVPSPNEFNYDFPALVASTFRDLSGPERQVLRAVSLLDSFSIQLASAAAGLGYDAPALALIDRPFIETEHSAPWPYSLHSLVRSVIRDADATAEDRWSSADWRRAAQRAFTALGDEFRAAHDAHDRARLMACLRQGLRLARDFELNLSWLTDAAYAYVADMVWEPVELPPTTHDTTATSQTAASTRLDSPSAALAAALTAIARRQRQHRTLTAAALRDVLASGQLPDSMRELPSYFLAECQRDLGQLPESLTSMRQVAHGGGRLAPDAHRGLLHLARRLGRFPDVRAAAESLGTDGHRHRILGDLWWPHGHITRACTYYAQARDEAHAHGQHGEAALSQACLAFAAAFQDRARAQEQIQLARAMLAEVTLRFAELHVCIAELFRDAGTDARLPERVTQVAADATAAGLTSSVAYARFAGCFHSAITVSPQSSHSALTELGLSVRGAEFAYLRELSFMMMGLNLDEDLPRAAWLDTAGETRNRWQRLVEGRRLELELSTGG